MVFWVLLAKSLVKVREGEMYNDLLFWAASGLFFHGSSFFGSNSIDLIQNPH
jgi:hypothetical protein